MNIPSRGCLGRTARRRLRASSRGVTTGTTGPGEARCAARSMGIGRRRGSRADDSFPKLHPPGASSFRPRARMRFPPRVDRMEQRVNPSENLREAPLARLPDPAAEHRSIEGRDRGDVHDADASRARLCLGKEHVPEGRGEPGVGGHRGDDDGRDPAPVERVALHDDARPPEARLRATGGPEIDPVDLPLRDHRSSRSMATHR